MSEVNNHELIGNKRRLITRSQTSIIWNFLQIVLKMRMKTIAFWVYIILSLGWIYFIRLFDRSSPWTVTPYTSPEFSNVTELDPQFLFYYSYNNSVGMMPKNTYTEYLANNLLFPVNNTPRYFASRTELRNFLANYKNPFLTFVFDDNVASNLKNLNPTIEVSNSYYVSSDRFSSYLMDLTLSYMGNNVEFNAESGDYSKPGRSDDINGANYAMLLSLSIVCLLLRSTLQMIELRELKLFLLLTISGARELSLWLTMFLSDLLFILPQSIGIALMINLCKATKNTSLTLVLVYTLLHNLSIYFFLVFFVSLIPKSNYFKYVSILCFVAAIFVPVSETIGFSHKTNKSTIKTLVFFFPQFSTYLFYQNIEFSIYMRRTMNWDLINSGLLIETGTIIWYSVYTILFYLFLFLVCLLFNPRPAGVPPIGWTNIFKSQYWKRLFGIKKNISESNLSSLEQPLIKIDKITKTYHGTFLTRALNEVSFDVQDGEVIVLIGPNGCGKSTLINSMTGTIDCDSGDLYLSGQLIDTGFSEMQNYIGICFQENVFFPTLSVYDHLRFFGKIRGASDDLLSSQIQTLVSSLDFASSLNSQAGSLSGGQKRKLCISLAFIGSPPIVILDEPTAGIDVSTRQTIWKSLSQFRDTTSFVSTHSLEEAESVSSRIFVMKAGNLVFTGTSSELRRAYNCGYRIAALGQNANVDALLKFVQVDIPEAVKDGERTDSILIPVDDRVVTTLESINSKLLEFQIDSINVTAEALEHVLLRLIADEE